MVSLLNLSRKASTVRNKATCLNVVADECKLARACHDLKKLSCVVMNIFIAVYISVHSRDDEC